MVSRIEETRKDRWLNPGYFGSTSMRTFFPLAESLLLKMIICTSRMIICTSRMYHPRGTPAA